jgi:hypothetical protein
MSPTTELDRLILRPIRRKLKPVIEVSLMARVCEVVQDGYRVFLLRLRQAFWRLDKENPALVISDTVRTCALAGDDPSGAPETV